MVRLLAYLFDLIVFVVLGKLVAMIIQRLFGATPAVRQGTPGAAHREDPAVRQGETVRDPVCGMFVSTELSHQLKLDGQTLHFCSRECLEQYQREVTHA